MKGRHKIKSAEGRVIGWSFSVTRKERRKLRKEAREAMRRLFG